MLGRVMGGKAPLIFPDTLALTAHWRDYGGSPWVGVSSAGISGSNSATAGTAPTTSTLNGHGVAVFNGTSSTLNLTGTLATYATTTAFCGWCLLNPANVSSGFSFWQDSGSKCQLTVGSLGTGKVGFQEVTIAVTQTIAASTWSLATWRLNGSTVQVGINQDPGSAGGTSTSSSGVSMTPLTGTVTLGSAGASAFFNGSIAEFGCINANLTATDFANIKSYINSRYGLAL